MSNRTNETGKKNFDTAELVGLHLLVKMDDKDTVSIADAGEDPLGNAMSEAFEVGDNIGINMRNKPGTVTLVSADSFAAGATLYGVNGGKVSDTDPGGGVPVARAHEPATAADQYIEAEFI